MEENKDKKNDDSQKLQLKKTFNVGQIKQSFSHGRTRSVSVEIKKKRVFKSLEQKEVKDNQNEKISEVEKDYNSKPESRDQDQNLRNQNLPKPESNVSNNNSQTEKKQPKKIIQSTNDNHSNSPNVQLGKEDKPKTNKFAKVPKSFENRRKGKLTISQALNDNNEKVRSLAAVRRAREKAKLRNLNNLENKETLEGKERKNREIIKRSYL